MEFVSSDGDASADEELWEARYDFARGKLVGRSWFGRVVSAFDGRGRKVSVRLLEARYLEDAEDLRRILVDMKCLRILGNHPNILELRDALYRSESGTLTLVTEWMDSDLYAVIRSRQQLSVGHMQYFAQQLFEALTAIHSLRIIHADIKPMNLLVRADASLKLGGFEHARVEGVEGHDAGEGSTLGELTGDQGYMDHVSLCYRPPECGMLVALDGDGSGQLRPANTTRAADVWAAAVTLAEILKRRPLFIGDDVRDNLSYIRAVCRLVGYAGEHDLVDHRVHPAAVRYMNERCVFPPGNLTEALAPPGTATVDRNPTAVGEGDGAAGGADSHEAAAAFLLSMLKMLPGKRPSARQVLNHPFIASDNYPAAPGSPQPAPAQEELIPAAASYDAVEGLLPGGSVLPARGLSGDVTTGLTLTLSGDVTTDAIWRMIEGEVREVCEGSSDWQSPGGVPILK